MSTDYTEWQPIELDGSPAGDQQVDLTGGYYAQVGPEDGEGPRAWSWTVIAPGGDGEAAGAGYGAGEGAVKAAVAEWADANLSAEPERETRQIPQHHTAGGAWCQFSGCDSYSGTCQMCAPIVTILRMWDRKTETIRLFASDELATAEVAGIARERTDWPAATSDGDAIDAWLAGVTDNDEGFEITHETVTGATS